MHHIAKNDQALNLFNRVCSLQLFLTKINVFIIPIKMTLFINMESKCLWGVKIVRKKLSVGHTGLGQMP